MSAFAHNLPIKKRFGQHFLRQQWVLDEITQAICLDGRSSVVEIGCGDGVLTQAILTYPIARLWVFEIDIDWVNYVSDMIKDARLKVFHENILDSDLTNLQPHTPWVLLANLPYQVTFPILNIIQRNRDIIQEGVIMVQEEVAQKLLKKGGRGYGYISLFFSHYFSWKQLSKVPPTAFLPPPKVNSRLLHFKAVAEPPLIVRETEFWKFIKICFQQPRRTLKNNLAQTHLANHSAIAPSILGLRAQQLSFEQLLDLWNTINSSNGALVEPA